MRLKKLAEKLAEYRERLSAGKARKVKPDHVLNVLDKLRRKEAELRADLAEAKAGERKARIGRKLAVAREHIARAEWLLREIEAPADPPPPEGTANPGNAAAAPAGEDEPPAPRDGG